MKYLFSFIFIFSCVNIFPQEIFIKDSVSKNPVPHAVISSRNKNTVSDNEGKFRSEFFFAEDTLSISHIAYKTKNVLLKNLKQNREILLTPGIINTEGVTVTSQKYDANNSSFKETIVLTEKGKQNYISVGDLLKNQSSLFIKDYGGAGSNKTVSSRGMSSENTIVLFNEARVNDLRTGIFDFNSLDINSVDKIIYLKSFDYDTPFSSPGGVIKLITDPQNEISKFSFHAKISSDQLKSFGTNILTGYAGFLFRFNAERSWSSNNYNYKFDNTEHKRANAWLSKTFISGDILRNGKDYTLKIYTNYSFFNNGIPGFIATNNLSSSQASNNNISNLNVLTANYFINENYSTSANLTYNYQSLVIDDPLGAIFFSNDKRESRLNDLTGSAKLKYNNSNWNANIGAEITTAKLANISGFLSSSGLVDNISRTVQRLFAGAKWSCADPFYHVKQISLTGLAAYENLDEKLPAESNSHSGSYKTGIMIQPSFIDNINIKVNYGDDYRLPTFNERYYSLIYSRYDLKSEKYNWFDAGIDYNFNLFGNSVISASYFDIKGKNKIIWIPSRGGLQIPRNVANFETKGFELSFSKNIIDSGYLLTVSYNYTDSRNKTKISADDNSYDKYIMYTPMHRLNINLTADISIFSFCFGTSYVSERYYSTDNVYKLSPYLICDASVSGSFDIAGIKNTISLTAYNINNENYFIIQSYPMPLTSYLFTYNLEI